MHLRAEAKRSPRRVHRHISAADHDDLLSALDRRIRILPIGLHQIISREELIRGVDAVRGLTRNIHKLRKPRPGPEKDRVEALLIQELVHRDGSSDQNIGLDLHSELFHILDLRDNHPVLWKTELRDPIEKHAARLMEGLKDRHLVAELREISRAGQPGGTRSDDGDLPAVRLSGLRGDIAVLPRPVGHIALELSDRDRLSLDPSHAHTLALRLLRADSSADSGKGRGAGDDIRRLLNISLIDLMDELIDLNGDRTADYTAGVFAVQTAGGLLLRLGIVIAEADLLEIGGAHLRILLRNRNLVLHHIHSHSLTSDHPLQLPQPPCAFSASRSSSIALPSSVL